MSLSFKSYTNGFCFTFNNKDMSVQEILLANGRPFNKRTVNALNRRNLANSEQLEQFNILANILSTGLSAISSRTLLRNDYNIDVMKMEYFELTNSQICDLQTVYNISKYNVSPKSISHSPMYYFFQYLKRIK